MANAEVKEFTEKEKEYLIPLLRRMSDRTGSTEGERTSAFKLVNVFLEKHGTSFAELAKDPAVFLGQGDGQWKKRFDEALEVNKRALDERNKITARYNAVVKENEKLRKRIAQGSPTTRLLNTTSRIAGSVVDGITKSESSPAITFGKLACATMFVATTIGAGIAVFVPRPSDGVNVSGGIDTKELPHIRDAITDKIAQIDKTCTPVGENMDCPPAVIVKAAPLGKVWDTNTHDYYTSISNTYLLEVRKNPEKLVSDTAVEQEGVLGHMICVKPSTPSFQVKDATDGRPYECSDWDIKYSSGNENWCHRGGEPECAFHSVEQMALILGNTTLAPRAKPTDTNETQRTLEWTGQQCIKKHLVDMHFNVTYSGLPTERDMYGLQLFDYNERKEDFISTFGVGLRTAYQSAVVSVQKKMTKDSPYAQFFYENMIKDSAEEILADILNGDSGNYGQSEKKMLTKILGQKNESKSSDLTRIFESLKNENIAPLVERGARATQAYPYYPPSASVHSVKITSYEIDPPSDYRAWGYSCGFY